MLASGIAVITINCTLLLITFLYILGLSNNDIILSREKQN